MLADDCRDRRPARAAEAARRTEGDMREGEAESDMAGVEEEEEDVAELEQRGSSWGENLVS